MKSKTIDTTTLKGLKKAERLQWNGYKKFASGYIITTSGLNKVTFTEPKEGKK